MSVKTYVYNGKEVVLTGRTASKKTRSDKTKTLHEIRPANVDVEQNMYNEWVEFDDLYQIEE